MNAVTSNERLHPSYEKAELVRGEFALRAFLSAREGAQCVMVINPICVGVSVNVPLLNALADTFTVVTWESRGTHLDDSQDIGDGLECADLLDDALAICSHFGLPAIDHIVGHCSGSQVATLLAGKLQPAPNSIVLGSASHVFPDADLSPYQRLVVPLWKSVAQGAEHMAGAIRNAMARVPYSADEPSRRLEEANRAPFRSERAIRVYAKLAASLLDCDQDGPLHRLECPVLILHSEADSIVSVDTALKLKDKIPGANLILYSQGGHFIFNGHCQAIEDAVAFMLASTHPTRTSTAYPQS